MGPLLAPEKVSGGRLKFGLMCVTNTFLVERSTKKKQTKFVPLLSFENLFSVHFRFFQLQLITYDIPRALVFCYIFIIIYYTACRIFLTTTKNRPTFCPFECLIFLLLLSKWCIWLCHITNPSHSRRQRPKKFYRKRENQLLGWKIVRNAHGPDSIHCWQRDDMQNFIA